MKLLIVGSTSSEIQTAINIANNQKANVIMVDSCDQAIDFLCRGKGCDLLLIDTKFDIKSLITNMKNSRISTPVVAYGVQSSAKDAVLAIKAGAKEFLPLPPDEKLIAAIFAALSDDNVNLIGSSEKIKETVAMADKIAKSNANVLITGQSGTGKEIFAQYIHKKSNRKDKRFVAVNCAAIPENLLESELFGHEKGAFTGALSRRIGKFEESSGGILMLDEISEMDIKLQAKLLRAIQEREIDRVGGSASVKVDLRIIATSNQDLKEAIKMRTFREDLYFRLNIINIELPKLADRIGDIQLLTDYFIKKYVENNHLGQKILSDDALEKLSNYSWPGNVRELENIIHRAVLISESKEILAEHIQIDTDTNKNQENLSESNKSLVNEGVNHLQSSNEKMMIFNTLGYCLGDLNKTANILGISIDILKAKIEKFNA